MTLYEILDDVGMKNPQDKQLQKAVVTIKQHLIKQMEVKI